jgi:inhibitor of KinA sporulation pathway (predicted exonuclease)
MENRLDQILVIDVEATCWEEDPPQGQQSEIIEIGICTLDIGTAQRLENASIIVHPERSTVSDYCTRLTTLTQADVDGGVPLREACLLLKERYHAEDRLWASYGDYDRKKFERECAAKRIAYPFGDAHLNVKNLFAVVQRLPQEVPLDTALGLLGLPLEGTHHRGDADAWNIARILGHLLRSARAGARYLDRTTTGETEHHHDLQSG